MSKLRVLWWGRDLLPHQPHFRIADKVYNTIIKIGRIIVAREV